MAQDYAKRFYNGRAWRRCRNAFMISKCYICERCGGVAVIAHHKRHITAGNICDPDVTLSWDNLEALCIDCHNREHSVSDSCAPGLTFDLQGNIVYRPTT